MYKNILDILKEKPVEYKQGKEKFWDDEHISKSMLQAHLNPDIEAASRKHFNIYRALKPGGFLILDAWTLEQYTEFTNCQSVIYDKEGFWNEKPYVCIKRNYRYDKTDTFLEQYIIITEQQSSCYNVWNETFNQEKICEELKKVGFNQFKLYSDVSGTTLSSDSKTLCVVAIKANI